MRAILRDFSGVWVLGGIPLEALRLGKDGRVHERRYFSEWGDDLAPIPADLTPPFGSDELYGYTSKGQLTRRDLADGHGECRLGPLIGEGLGLPALADLDGDGRVDVLTTRSCTSCTSNQIVWWGVR